MEFVKAWVTNIAVVVVFMTAIELILPNNDIKKYGKFVMGLILMITIMKPILSVIDKGFNFESYVYEAENYLQSSKLEIDYEKYKQKNIESTMELFKKNIEIQCEETLKEEFYEKDFEVDVDVSYLEESKEFIINNIEIWVEEKGVKRVKKVQNVSINGGAKDKESIEESELSEKIKLFIGGKVSLQKNKINVYENE